MAWTNAAHSARNLNSSDRYFIVKEAALNDSDKTFAFDTDAPNGVSLLQVVAIHASLSATATAGTRILVGEVSDGTDVVREFRFDENVPVNETRTWDAWPGATPKAQTFINYEQLPGSLFMAAGFTLRIYDQSASDAAADDLTIELHCLEID
jgi:hypothetical protein